jgi:hypothetical protein
MIFQLGFGLCSADHPDSNFDSVASGFEFGAVSTCLMIGLYFLALQLLF